MDGLPLIRGSISYSQIITKRILPLRRLSANEKQGTSPQSPWGALPHTHPCTPYPRSIPDLPSPSHHHHHHHRHHASVPCPCFFQTVFYHQLFALSPLPPPQTALQHYFSVFTPVSFYSNLLQPSQFPCSYSVIYPIFILIIIIIIQKIQFYKVISSQTQKTLSFHNKNKRDHNLIIVLFYISQRTKKKRRRSYIKLI